LTINNVQPGDSGSYDVIATGNGTVTSTTAILSIGQPIQFAAQPLDASVVVGSSAAIHVEVTGDGPFAYQWQSIPNSWSPPSNIVDGAAYQNTTTATLWVSPAPFAGGLTQLTCMVTDVHGSPVNSRTVSLVTNYPQCLTMTTLAGSGAWGPANGAGSAAQFGGPFGIAVDGAGNLYVADTSNHTVRKITSDGTVTTVAGSAGNPGSNDGAGTAARFYYPRGIAIDAVGNLYVADTDNHTIRKITPYGMVTTLAGVAGSPGSNDGDGTTARFYNPGGIVSDAASNLFVTDNNTIRKITPAGVVTTFAGLAGASGNVDGIGSAAQFHSPEGIAIDTAGNLYVTDNDTIRKIMPGGVVMTLAGLAGNIGSVDGIGSAARFYGPGGIAVDAADNLYVADSINYTIRRITPAGVVSTLAGQVGASGRSDGVGSTAQFDDPTGIAVNVAGSVFVADTENNVIRQGVPTTLAARLFSLSTRGLAGTGDQTLIAGFATGGNGNKQLLLRGIGPGLTPFGVSGMVADPALTLFNSVGAVLQQNNDWGGTATLTTAFAQVWAFPLSPNSKDAALLASLPGGVYTAHLAAQSGTGVALLEAYDTDPGTPATRLASLSARDQVGTGDNILIAGFAITGNVSRTVLIRGIGPTLARYGVSGLLANPQLQVFQGSTLLAQNDDWGGDTTLAAIAAQVNTFALDANSKDAALLLTLPPGAYTAQVSGVGNTTGVALVEIYEVP